MVLKEEATQHEVAARLQFGVRRALLGCAPQQLVTSGPRLVPMLQSRGGDVAAA